MRPAPALSRRPFLSLSYLSGQFHSLMEAVVNQKIYVGNQNEKAIAHQIIQAHGGTIEVSSLVGQGTTFLITLPIPVSHDPVQMAFSF